MSLSNRNLENSLRGLSKPNALSQLSRSHWLHCSLHGTKDRLISQIGASVLVELFRVKFDGNLMVRALNQLVRSHQWIPTTWTLF